MEVVVALSKSDEGSYDVVARRVAVVKWLVAKPVRKGIDAEGGLLNEEDAEDAGIDEATHPVTPAEACDKHREDETHEKDDGKIVLVLPPHDNVVIEIRDIGTANTLRVLLHKHPAKVRVQQTLANRVGVFLGVGVAVVSAVIPSPPSDGTLDGTSADGGKENLERKRSLVGSVRPKSVVTSGDAEASSEVVKTCPDGGLEEERSVGGTNEAKHRDANNQSDIQPVDMLVPIIPRNGSVGDVRFLGIIALVAVWLVLFCHG